jgi:V/A-type H+/Na+-transporting ATPase subunit I
MFFPQEMTQIRLIIPAADLLTVTKELANQEIFHQIDGHYAPPEEATGAPNSWNGMAGTYASFENRIVGIIQALGIDEGMPPSTPPSSIVEIETVRKVIGQIDHEVKKTQEALVEEQKRLEQFQNILTQLEPISGTDLDLDVLRNPAFTHSIVGIIPNANIERLQTSLEHIPFVFLTLRQDEQRAVVWLSGTKKDAEVLDRAARSAYLNPLRLPEGYSGTPSEVIKLVQADMEHSQQVVAEQRTVMKRLAQEQKVQIQTLLWQVRISRILSEAIGRYDQFRYTYVISGWVPSAKVADFSLHLREVCKEISIETSSVKRGNHEEKVPVALNNPKAIRPFQLLVTTYSDPRYAEVDPTFLLVITFPFIFGAMFGDAGQGILLALLGLLLSSGKLKMLNALSSLGGIITACGLSATVFGFLYGSIFGFEGVLPAIIFRPMENPLEAMAFAIGVGVILLSIGYLLNMVNAWTIREWGGLLFHPHGIAGLVLYWSLVGLAIEVIISKYPIPPIVFGLLALLTGVAVMFSELLGFLIEGKQPEFEGGLVTYIFRSVFELFEVLISLLSNSISFVRIGAFSIAHVGLITVVFIMAQLVSPGHGIGYWLVIVLGNLFVIGFEGIIVGIQSLRLTYYEFFSKFFNGGGLRYEPLTLQLKAQK